MIDELLHGVFVSMLMVDGRNKTTYGEKHGCYEQQRNALEKWVND